MINFQSKLPFKAFIFISFFASSVSFSQATIEETTQSIKTYPYSDPNPIATMGVSEKVYSFYPYYVFDGYTTEAKNKDWKVVELNNPYIEVTVMPEVGGKVMGAIEKSTGNEFIYLNHVMKFRSIGIRGPWTSGGIEHNFGLDLGHAPWASAPVDYKLQKNEDGSVSCFVGGLDLASRTQWRVEIRLPKNKAYFETNSLWYNPTPLHDAYLSWENAAYRASDDLQFYFPGTHHIGHDGSAHSWPIDENGVDLSLYKNNNFGGHKFYHVVGAVADWFGGYWHDKNFGSAHWSPYSDAPGKKIWIWSLSRSGAIWEDLLTDNDGQYVELQSGVKFNQAGLKSGFNSPFNQLSIGPFYTETKNELWFPTKGLNGIVDASPYGTLNVTQSNDSLRIAISPTTSLSDSLKIMKDNKVLFKEYIRLKPMQDYEKSIFFPKNTAQNITVNLGNEKLAYSTKKDEIIDRPFISEDTKVLNSLSRLYRLGEDERAMRNYGKAMDYYKKCIGKDPNFSAALSRIAELYYRKGEYSKALSYVLRVLEKNTYDGAANYIYGNIERSLGNLTKALEAYSVAARTMEYRSGSYTLMADISLEMSDFVNAEKYAQKALDYNKNNLRAYELLGTSYRKLDKVDKSKSVFKELLSLDPLNHYAHFEQYMLDSNAKNLSIFNLAIRNELPHETYLELALQYVNGGLNEEAISVLENAPDYPTVSYWLAYLNKDSDPEKSKIYLQKAVQLSPYLVFPFRLETIPVLSWAEEQIPSWKNTYYLGLIYWSKSDIEKAYDQFGKHKDDADYAPFYIMKGLLSEDKNSNDASVLTDFKKANKLAPEEWRTWNTLNTYFHQNGQFKEGLANAKKAYNRFRKNPIIAIDYAKSLLSNKKYDKSIQILNNSQVLPHEHAREGHDIYVLAKLSNALKKIEQRKYKDALQDIESSKLWPENLGSGKPYDPDNRLQNYLAAFCEDQLHNAKEADDLEEDIMDYTLDSNNWNGQNNSVIFSNYLGAKTLRNEGKEYEADKLMKLWKTKQDSIRDWNIAEGSSSDVVKWVFAKYNGDKETAQTLKIELLENDKLGLNTIFFKALALTEDKKDAEE